MTNGEGFSPDKGALTQEYFLYFTEKQRREKAPLFRRIDNFQTRPNDGDVIEWIYTCNLGYDIGSFPE